MAARVMRETTAICGRASTSTGRMRLRRFPLAHPATGSQASVRPKTIWKIGATTKFGMVRPRARHARDEIVDGAVLAHGGDGAEGAADDNREGQRKAAERHRDRQAPGEELTHGEVAQDEGGPEIAPHDGAEIEPVLLDQRLVELIDPVEVLHHLGLERPLQIERSARGEPDQEERDRDDDEKGRDGRQETAKDEGEHG